jgi:Mrp family chromosome partitioning ATPase
MTLREFLYVLRRWRSVVIAGLAIGVVVGWVSAPGKAARSAAFEATHTLLLVNQAGNYPLLYDQAPAIATLGAVPERVATRIGVDRRTVQSMVKVEAPPNKGNLLITARSVDPRRAEAVANATAEELVVELGGQNSPLQTLEPAEAAPVSTTEIEGPRSRPGRAFLVGAFGLLLGMAGAFGIERFDTRIRSKSAAEVALGGPVIAEIPGVPRPERGRLLSGERPSPVVEAYRVLRTSVDKWAEVGDRDRGRIIVLTSPMGGEGATVTVAHLASTLGETGRSVLVISADLRRPRLHEYFDRALEPGLADVLGLAPDVRGLGDLNLATGVRGVRFVPSGAPIRNPAPLLERLRDHLEEARALGDFVLIDAPPLLTTSEAADLARLADGVLLVVRAGRTSVRAATRSAELLQRLGIPVLGGVLLESNGSVGRTYAKGFKRSADPR